MSNAFEEFSFAIYPTPFMDWSAAARWFRDAMEAVGLAAVGLEPMPHAAPWWAGADRLMLGGGAVLTSPDFVRASGDPGWAMSLYYMDHATRGGVVASVPPWPEDEGGRSEVWPWLTDLMERLAVAAEADACFVNGRGDGGDEERLPSEAEIAAAIPAAITAWNYFGPARLDARRRTALAALPAYESRPIGEAWLLRPVEGYSDPLPAGFLAAYSDVAGAPAEFLRAHAARPTRAAKQAPGRKGTAKKPARGKR